MSLASLGPSPWQLRSSRPFSANSVSRRPKSDSVEPSGGLAVGAIQRHIFVFSSSFVPSLSNSDGSILIQIGKRLKLVRRLSAFGYLCLFSLLPEKVGSHDGLGRSRGFLCGSEELGGALEDRDREILHVSANCELLCCRKGRSLSFSQYSSPMTEQRCPQHPCIGAFLCPKPSLTEF